ncbi:MAG TPA: phosphatase PAP2 family protein [Gemmatimonadaceae bacterium]|nr:phosphatase PAP2 family protein [Gemmatimonadaceae bacterium]
MRHAARLAVALLLVAETATAQTSDTTSRGDKTFLTRRDLAISGVALGTAALLSVWDRDIAVASRESRFQDNSVQDFANAASKVNETTLTVGGIVFYGIGRLTKSRTMADVALHATESVVLASVASQLIRGPLGRTRPWVTADTNQYEFEPFRGFREFKNRAFPSIHTSSSMAVATVLSMETHRRHPRATPYVAPVLFAAGLLPGLARIQLDQHWASDIFAGAFMGVFAGYKVTKYSHDHPKNRFDRVLLKASVTQAQNGQFLVGFSPF